MNKKMRELLAQIEAKTKEARGFMDGENKDVAKASAILDEVAELKAEYETEKRLYEAEKAESVPADKAGETKAKKSADEIIKAFGRDAKHGFRTKEALDGVLNEGTPADGGYTVPEDIWTRVQEFRQAEFSFLDLVRREVVHTATGARTFKKRSQYTGFGLVPEGGAIGPVAETPQFERIPFTIKKYAGYMPMTNELRYDSDANVAQIIIEWLGQESRATANKLILEQIHANGDAVDLKDLDGIKKALNVTLGSAFKGSSRVITNDDGLQYLDTLKKKSDSNEYLLTPDPANPMALRLTAGATTVPLVVVPNAVMPTPSEGADQGKIPFIIGDLYEGVVYWDREWMSIAESAIASIGDFNAFEQDLTLYRAIEREDVTLRDTEAFVVGYIVPAGE